MTERGESKIRLTAGIFLAMISAWLLGAPLAGIVGVFLGLAAVFQITCWIILNKRADESEQDYRGHRK